MNERIPVLDQGYVQLIETWGADDRIIEAARMSTAKGFLGWGPKCRACGDAFDDPERDCPNPAEGTPYVHCGRGGHIFDEPGDEKLLKFLWDHNHATPFEMAGVVIEVKAPIMVFREWQRHRTQSYNEMSARYTPLPNENYMPTVERVLLANHAGGNKQAQGAFQGKVLTEQDALDGFAILATAYEAAQSAYDKLLALGWPKELARLPVPVGRYSAMRASANLRNWFAFLKLRADKAAQWEIRQFAFVVAKLIEQSFPRTYTVAKDSTGLS